MNNTLILTVITNQNPELSEPKRGHLSLVVNNTEVRTEDRIVHFVHKNTPEVQAGLEVIAKADLYDRVVIVEKQVA